MAVLSSLSPSNKIYHRERGDFLGFLLLETKKKKGLQHWPLSISLMLCLIPAVFCEMFGCSEAGCENKHKSPGSSHGMSGSAMTYAAPALQLQGRLEAYTSGRHPYIQQHKVIVWKSIVAQRRAYWQLETAGLQQHRSKSSSSLFLLRTYCTKELRYPRAAFLFFFLWDFMNIPRQRIGMLISPLQLNLRQWHIIQTG